MAEAPSGGEGPRAPQPLERAPQALPSAEDRRRSAEEIARQWKERASAATMPRSPSWQTFEQQIEQDRAPLATQQPQQPQQEQPQGFSTYLPTILSASYWQSMARSLLQYVASSPVGPLVQPILEAVGIRRVASREQSMRRWRISASTSAAFRAAVLERQRRRHLGNALATLRSAVTAPDCVVAHQRRFEDEIAGIIARGQEEKSFFAVNVTTIISRWTELRHGATNMLAELRVNITGDPVLITLMATLKMAMRVETIQDVDILARIAEQHPIWDSFSHSPTGKTPFVWDSCPVRPSAHLSASLRAGIRAFVIDSVDEAVRILHAQKRLQIIGPISFVVLVRTRGPQSATSAADVYGSRVAQMNKFAARLKKIRANVIGVTTFVRDQRRLDSVMPTLEAAIECLQAHEHSIQFVSLQGLDQGAVEECWIATNLRQQDESVQRLRAKFRIPRVFCDATRYLLADTHVLFARVIGEKPAFDADGMMVGHQYYIDDGCYGSFGRMHVTGGDQHASEAAAPPFTVQVTGNPTELGGESTGSVATIWGQTCDSIDCVAQQVVLPNLELGSWLSFTGLDQTGTTYSTQFNGFPAPSKKYCVHTGFVAM